MHLDGPPHLPAGSNLQCRVGMFFLESSTVAFLRTAVSLWTAGPETNRQSTGE
jgi:hypothetical protein